MKLLLDERIPRSFKRQMTGHDCQTVPEMGWAGKKNGELLSLAKINRFDAFLTIDRGLEYQQNLSDPGIAIILVKSKSNRLLDLVAHAPAILDALKSARAGQLIHVS